MARVICTLRNKPSICKHSQNKAGCFSCRDEYIAKLEAALRGMMLVCIRCVGKPGHCPNCAHAIQILEDGV